MDQNTKTVEYANTSVDPVVGRLEIEYGRKEHIPDGQLRVHENTFGYESHNNAVPSGLEVAALLNAYEISIWDEEYETAHELSLPVWGRDQITFLAKHLEGSEAFKGRRLCHGTSFSRMDAKELIQILGIQRFLRTTKEGLSTEDSKFAYFIDPNAHTSHELAEATAHDYGVPIDQIKSCFGTNLINANFDVNIVQARNQNYPPRFYEKPVEENIVHLPIPQNIKDIWIQAAANPHVENLGEWRVEVERIQLRSLFRALGMEEDAVEIFSFTDLVNNHGENITAETIIESANKASKYSNLIQRAIVDINQNNVPENRIYHLDNENKDRLGIFVHRLENGERITIDANLDGWIYINGTRTRFEGVNYKHLRNMTLQEILEDGAYQLSGVGYYMAFADLSNGGTALYLDDYEQANGPAGAICSTEGKIPAIAMPKGFVGTNGNFDVPPDIGCLLCLDARSNFELNNLIDLLSTQLENSDISTVSGVNIARAKNGTYTARLSVINNRYIWNQIDYLYKSLGGISTTEAGLFDDELYPILEILRLFNPVALQEMLSTKDERSFYQIRSLQYKQTALSKLEEYLRGIDADMPSTFWPRLNEIRDSIAKILLQRRIEEKSNALEAKLISLEDRYEMARQKIFASLEVTGANGEYLDAMELIINADSNLEDKISALKTVDSDIWSSIADGLRREIAEKIEISEEDIEELSKREKQFQAVSHLKKTLDNLRTFKSVFGLDETEVLVLYKEVTGDEMYEFGAYFDEVKEKFSIDEIKIRFPNLYSRFKNELPNYVHKRAEVFKTLGHLKRNAYAPEIQKAQTMGRYCIESLVAFTKLNETEIALTGNNCPINLYLKEERAAIDLKRLQSKVKALSVMMRVPVNVIKQFNEFQLRHALKTNLDSIYNARIDFMQRAAKERWNTFNKQSMDEHKINAMLIEKDIQGRAVIQYEIEMQTLKRDSEEFIKEYQEWWLSAVNYVRANANSYII